MSSTSDAFEKHLKNAGYSLTSARKKVFGGLESHEPQTVNELVKRLVGQVDRASVYRTIALFEKLGVVQRLQMGWKYKLELSDLFNYHHHHITCSSCGKIVPLREDVLLESAIDSVAQEYGFTTVRHQLEIQGICKDCNKTA